MFIQLKNKLFICLIVVTFCGALTPLASADAAVEDVFRKHEVVPDVIPVAPNDFLEVTYDNELKADKGIELTPFQVKAQPIITWNAEDGAYYTLIMTDPDAPSRVQPKAREFKHWLVGNIPGNDIGSGDVLTAYVGSGPPKNTGLHRYVFLLYKQQGKLTFDEPRVGNNSRDGRPKFKAAKFAEKYNLGTPLAGNFYQAKYDDYVHIVHQQLSGN